MQQPVSHNSSPFRERPEKKRKREKILALTESREKKEKKIDKTLSSFHSSPVMRKAGSVEVKSVSRLVVVIVVRSRGLSL